MSYVAFSAPVRPCLTPIGVTLNAVRWRPRAGRPQHEGRIAPSCAVAGFVGRGGAAGGAIIRDSNGMLVLPLSVRRHPPIWLLVTLAAIALYMWRWLAVRRHIRQRYARGNLSGDIGAFYDTRSAAWESVWGEHMHHGLYDTGLRGIAAQQRTMDELLRLGNIGLHNVRRALDVGCGIGGGSRYLARAGCAHVTALTLSEQQAKRASELNDKAGFKGRVSTYVRDVLKARLPPRAFDVIWALESAEHIAPKAALARECARVLRPGGTLMMVVWCIRESDMPFSVSERYSIRRIMEEYCLPPLSSASEISTELVRAGFRGVSIEDWTKSAAPFWGEVARSAALDPRGWAVLFRHGWPLLKSALAMRHVISGIRQGAFRLYAFSARMPTVQERALEEANAIKC